MPLGVRKEERTLVAGRKGSHDGESAWRPRVGKKERPRMGKKGAATGRARGGYSAFAFAVGEVEVSGA